MTNPSVLTEQPHEAAVATKTYVIDTSVLLSDPWALRKFAEHDVVLPIVVISELEGKRHHPELGWFARQALRFLEDLRATYEALDQPLPVNAAGGTLRVELNHQDQSLLPAAFRGPEGDHRILACALNLQHEGKDTVLVTKDVPLRVKAGAVGLQADEYHAQDVVLTGYTGMATVQTTAEVIDELYGEGEVLIDGSVTTAGTRVEDLPVHCGVVRLQRADLRHLPLGLRHGQGPQRAPRLFKNQRFRLPYLRGGALHHLRLRVGGSAVLEPAGASGLPL